MNETTDHSRLIELERAQAAREALERAAERLETYKSNDTYEKAFKLGARLVRDLKPK